MGAEDNSSDPKPSEDGSVSHPKPVQQEAPERVALNLQCPNGAKYTIRVTLDSTVAQLKNISELASHVPAQQQRLIYKGRILEDDQTLQSYGLQADHTVHLVRGFSQTQHAPPPAHTTSSGVGSNDDGSLTENLIPGSRYNTLARAAGADGISGGTSAAAFPEFELIQQQFTPNQNMMTAIMNMPAMHSLLNNPDLIRNLLMNNPQLREIMDRNPELAQVLNDPNMLRQMADVARNPELMREMMRHNDLAMTGVESTTEGFNVLRQMYENVQQPFLNGTTMDANAASNQGSNPFAALLGNQGRTQQRDTPNNPSTTGSETAMGIGAPNTSPLPNPWSNTDGGNQTNTTAWSSSAGNAGAPSFGILAGNGIRGMPDSNQVNQLLRNPAVSQMLQSVLSNPEYMNQLRSMVDSNPQVREMMHNPELLRQLTSPENIQQMLTLQESLFSQLNQQPTNQELTQPGTAAGSSNNNQLEELMNTFSGLGNGSFSVPNQPDVQPQDVYATQLSQLQEMGFFDTQENIRALGATAGNVHAAVEWLLGNPDE